MEAEDHPGAQIKMLFEASFDFIDEGVKTGKVLVHCVRGVSRSSTICAAYIMRKYNLKA